MYTAGRRGKEKITPPPKKGGGGGGYRLFPLTKHSPAITSQKSNYKRSNIMDKNISLKLIRNLTKSLRREVDTTIIQAHAMSKIITVNLNLTF